MTTPNEDLILKLRGQAYTTCRPDQLCDQAADLLQSQAERIAELEVIVASYGELDVEQAKHIACMESDLDTLRAQLEAIAAAEPVLVVEKEPDYWSGGHFHEGSKPHVKPTKVWSLPIGTKLFTRTMPALDVTELVKDAARYRFIREVPYSDYIHNVMSHQKNSVMNAAIDAAIAKGVKQ